MGNTTRTRARKVPTELRREQLAQLALELAGARGFGALSVAAVAERAGIVPSAVYKHFSGREELVDAVVDRIGESLTQSLAEARCRDEDPLAALEQLALLHCDMIRTKGIPRVVFSDEIHLKRPRRKTKLCGFIRQYLDGVADLVQTGQRVGRFRVDRDPSKAAVLFLGVVQPTGILWHLSDGVFDMESHLRSAWEAFAAWLLPLPDEEPGCEPQALTPTIGGTR